MNTMNTDTPETDRRIIQQDPRMCGCGYKSEITYADFARRLERERNQVRKERDELLDALKTIEFFVMYDYYPNIATPEYKAAVGKMQYILEKH